MIVVKLWGGLCNQMFQYAFGVSLSLQKCENLVFDIQFYEKQPLYVDNRNLEIVDAFNLNAFNTIKRPEGVDWFQNKITSNIVRRMNYFHCKLPNEVFYVREKMHTYKRDIPYRVNSTNYYDGYWQTEKYFKSIEGTIRKIFKPNKRILDMVECWSLTYYELNTIAVHIRRRDMVGKNKGYSEKAIMDYYERAMKFAAERIKEPVFVVFSDDILWCKANISQKYGPVVFQDKSNGALFDLFAISKCKNGIMSQSTFSWWGNWLGEVENKDRLVIAPRGSYLNDNFIPLRWITV